MTMRDKIADIVRNKRYGNDNSGMIAGEIIAALPDMGKPLGWTEVKPETDSIEDLAARVAALEYAVRFRSRDDMIKGKIDAVKNREHRIFEALKQVDPTAFTSSSSGRLKVRPIATEVINIIAREHKQLPFGYGETTVEAKVRKIIASHGGKLPRKKS